MKMTGQTRVIIATAMALAAVDIAVRLHQPSPVVLNGNSDVVSAREFRLVDSNGNTRITMTMDENDEPGIRLFDRNGQVRAQLDTWQSTPSLILNGPDGSRRVYFGMDEQGGGMLDMMNPDGAEMMSMEATDGMPKLLLSDQNGSPRASFNVDRDGRVDMFAANMPENVSTSSSSDLSTAPTN
jgi:hypothetical protein